MRYSISLTVTLQAALVLTLLCVLGVTLAIGDVTEWGRQLGVEQAVMSSAAISIPSLIKGVVVDAGSTTSRYAHERKTQDLGFPHSTHWR